MHIYFIGIGGSGIGPLALIAKQAGHKVSGSDIAPSSYIDYLKSKDIDVSLDQTGENIKKIHNNQPIDWIVGVSAIIRGNKEHSELKFAEENNIKVCERDALLNLIIEDRKLKLVAVAGTHGKTTTTAMIIWLFKQLGIPISYSVGAKLSFADMSGLENGSEFFIYECDEFHRNFLNFYPYISAITGIAWDHHEIYETKNEYNDAFIEFLNQSKNIVIYSDDCDEINWNELENTTVLDKKNQQIEDIEIPGKYFREDAWLAVNTVSNLTGKSVDSLMPVINNYPGAGRRMEKLASNLYSDYAHTPEKIEGCIDTASEMLELNQKLVVVYEPLTNRRQHYIKDIYQRLFINVDKLYWVPSYQAREDSSQRILNPQEFIDIMENKSVAEASTLDDELWYKVKQHTENGDFVVLISGGGGGSLDEWARNKLKS